ncbi:glycosyltransferase [Mesorhizobium sp. M1050]|uniref:glycosyltransferase n=1 Tax=Mesorhizobium sp. M1050 TaxID=2957051 RepID=UPI00333BB062
MIHDDATAAGVVSMFDAEQTIGATLVSIRQQAYHVLSMVAVDDGSTGGSPLNIVPDDRFLWQAIAGYVSGLLFCLRTRRG